MVAFDATLERLRALPHDRKEAVAAQIDALLEEPEDLLSPEQWAAIEARLDVEPANIPHEDVVAAFDARFRK